MKIIIHSKHITQAYFSLYCIKWPNLEKTSVIDLQQEMPNPVCSATDTS